MRDRLYVHIVWTTRDREPSIDATVARFLARFLPAVARQERAGLHAVGMVRITSTSCCNCIRPRTSRVCCSA